MPSYIAIRRGTVFRAVSQRNNAGVMPFQMRMQGMSIGSDNATARAIITQAGVMQNGNFQFLHTIGETIYVYVFGDRIGELRVSGVAFMQMCRNGGPAQTGMAQVLAEYQANKLSSLGRPVIVNFGDTPFKGFLTGMNLEVADAENSLGQWSFRFNTFPGR
jgi:hypothetical protein